MADEFTRSWIIEKSIDICSQYRHGVLTLRALHYQLVAAGMTNSMRHYKRVVGAMIKARWDGYIEFEQFSDHDREALGVTSYHFESYEDKVEQAKEQIGNWMTMYYRNRWENQPILPEVWIEKKALQGVFLPVCERFDVALCACKGYPSLTFLNDAKDRFKEMQYNDKRPVILYFGDYDATGEDIPRSIEDNLWKLGVSVEVRRISLMEEQVLEWGLPPAPTKEGDSRAKNWDGLGQVELDAVNPNMLRELITESVSACFDDDLHDILSERVEEERENYIKTLKEYVQNLGDED